MGIPDNVRMTWIDTQRKFAFPVNAIGVKIAPNDVKTRQVWYDEGIDADGRFPDFEVTPSAEKSSARKPDKPVSETSAVATKLPGLAKAFLT